MKNSSWENVSKWYDTAVGKEGHYYHKHVVLPGVMRLLNLSRVKEPSILDLACGQGVLARHLPQGIEYMGIDCSKSLIAAAKKGAPKQCTFIVHDLQRPLTLEKRDFTHATVVLALQNMHDPAPVFHSAASHLKKGGSLVIVLNHPCFRIPRQSSWGFDEKKKWQYRRVDKYMSPLEIPISMDPGKGGQEKTLSYHYPLSTYVNALDSCGFYLQNLEEWCSDKKSSGKKAKMENRAREEFPLFMALLALKR